MGKFKNEMVILLTGTIRPNTKDILSVKNPETRKHQYIEALSFYLEKTDLNIVFAENSGTSLETYFEGNQRIEFLTFLSSNTSPDRGKGWKELEIIDYSLRNSKMLQGNISILKITGRLKLLNIKKIEKQVKGLDSEIENFILCNVYKASKMDSRCFLFKKDFWPILFNHGQSIDLCYSFERALWNSVCEYDLTNTGKYYQFFHPLRIEGISGGLGIPYRNGKFVTIFKVLRHYFILPLVYRKSRKGNL